MRPIESIYIFSNKSKIDFWIAASWVLTTSRIIIAVLCIYQVFAGSLSLASLYLLLLIAIDIADGRIILLSKHASKEMIDRRHITDAVLDRLIIQGVLLSVFAIELLPLWLYIIFLIREIILILISSLKFLKHHSTKANTASRSATLVMGLITLNLLGNFLPNNLLVVMFCVLAGLGIFYQYKIFQHS